ncbi:MAG: ATP-binding cassette domain-containing protein [Desulfobulbus sp.]|jgi:lipooligosaccharide transport system ATP-binding protein|uniref:ABC transporter ATP-binding protein n=1 Tax=Desulfobulbus sp. TaxID=895 RepID=UPI002847AE9E|nr:ATP-binding cassette domain-containing protein [Desulfobulbus sp.]MDR2549309.1 ATP-binding cassette domain-containing protein [Desulfobulbus sp.]
MNSKGVDNADCILRVNNLGKRFNGLVAVDSVSFAVRTGECFGLLGPNGAGKTSTIRMMYGFSPPNSGTISILGLDIATQWRLIRSRIGICQQDNTLDPDLTVFQNLLIFAGYFRIPRHLASERAEELLQFFALDKKREAKVGELSGGLARRLTLARALINDPELIILDEPTTGLDPQSRHLLWERLHALRARGKTFILTTHYMEEAAQLCDRLVIMDHGRILVEGTPASLINEHVGRSIIEIDSPEREGLRQFLRSHQVDYDELANRFIIYSNGDLAIEQALREGFCSRQCTFRSATLEDVFLRLTGRELRE